MLCLELELPQEPPSPWVSGAQQDGDMDGGTSWGLRWVSCPAVGDGGFGCTVWGWVVPPSRYRSTLSRGDTGDSAAWLPGLTPHLRGWLGQQSL